MHATLIWTVHQEQFLSSRSRALKTIAPPARERQQVRKATPETQICTSTPDQVTVHGLDLAHDLIGSRTYSEALFHSLTKRFPSVVELQLFDACMVSIMEHGFNASSIATRLAAASNLGEIQVAIAAGVLNIGPVFAGSMEGCAELLNEMANSPSEEATAVLIAKRFCDGKKAVPGFGHPLHKPRDPRATALLEILQRLTRSKWGERIATLSCAVDRAMAQTVPINVTGACAAILLELGLELRVMRGIAVVARSGGLIAHAQEEHLTGSAREIVAMTSRRFLYRHPQS